MRVSARMVTRVVALAVVVAFAGVSPARTNAAAEGLMEFDNFVCPGACPIGADPCCAKLPPLCVPGPCEQ